jgi:glycosylphosphatidylinositol transamidase (GPIT) subunit GPI8
MEDIMNFSLGMEGQAIGNRTYFCDNSVGPIELRSKLVMMTLLDRMLSVPLELQIDPLALREDSFNMVLIIDLFHAVLGCHQELSYLSNQLIPGQQSISHSR